MFIDFLYILRKLKIPVSLTEWMTLMEALSKGFINSLDEFYFLARAILVKSETYYDYYDIAFQEYFAGTETPAEILEQILEWLKDPLERSRTSEERMKAYDQMKFDELIRELEKRLEEQTSQHDGGGYWIGRGGVSPFGHSGYHPAGIRIGGKSTGRGAIQIAQERRFRNYRSDTILDVRQMKVALKSLRQFSRIGAEDELDLVKTIKATAQNAGDLEFIWGKSRKNAVKVLLLMDAGGSMDPFADLCSQLFTAAHSSSHFKDFQYYYFHNCIYDNLFRDIEQHDVISTGYILENLDSDYKVILVGDARMATYELTEQWGSINYYQRNEIPGITYLKRLADHFTHAVWLNPEKERFWIHPTVRLISKIFPMFPLTLDGLEEATRKLIVKR